MPFRAWCEACKGQTYNDGCKVCDADYYGTLLVILQNELSCIEHAKDLSEIKRRVDDAQKTVDEMWELRPLALYQNLVWRL